jgi:hypothetical protein
VTPQRFRQIEEAFQKARDLTSLDRVAYLEQLRDQDLDLHAEVTSLLDSEPNAAEVLHRAIAAGGLPR